MDRDGTESKTIQSVENAFRILNELLRREQATVTELSDVVGLSKGTVHHYLQHCETRTLSNKSTGNTSSGFDHSRLVARHASERQSFKSAKMV
ncbi:winged helix-turn-helix transcriptional regulator [Halocatena marina]|uniref:Winged helix-turn-helix transcriptional regulator n=1 Tax=Halocatena marina TaxID=2934937 RepID=A0ABD5YQ84_9EURY